MTDAEKERLRTLADLAIHLSHRIVEAQEAHNELSGRRLANTLRDVCREMVPLLRTWEREPDALSRVHLIRDVSEISEADEIEHFRLRPDGKGYEPR